MKVFKCIISGVEFYSDAKAFTDVMDEEGNDTGLVRVQAVSKTEGGVAVNTGGDEEVDEAEEVKLDQFWMFPDIENEFEFAKKKQFKEDYWAFFQDGFVKLAKHKKLFSSKEEFQAAGKRFKAAQKWILANIKELQFFGPESYMIEGETIDEKFAEDTFCSNFAYVKYEQDGSIYFYFVKDAFESVTF